jgi:hypothetical protein
VRHQLFLLAQWWRKMTFSKGCAATNLPLGKNGGGASAAPPRRHAGALVAHTTHFLRHEGNRAGGAKNETRPFWAAKESHQWSTH